MTPLLALDDIHVRYAGTGSRRGDVVAVRGASLRLDQGECLGIVGESGCGKSSLAHAIAGLVPVASGRMRYKGRELDAFSSSDRAAYRDEVQVIFQDPLGALNPRQTVGQTLREVLWVHRQRLKLDLLGRDARVDELLRDVGLGSAFLDRYPHELSGGQRQRVGIARAIALRPQLIIADEPVSALDVSVQVQILNLLRALVEKHGLTLLLIAHDLAVVRYMCHRVVVMYLGEVMECGAVESLFEHPCHPYTEALLSAVPDIDRCLPGAAGRERIVLRGDTPSASEVLAGCPFHTRCHRVQPVCATKHPSLRTCAEGHRAACHFLLCGGDDDGNSGRSLNEQVVPDTALVTTTD